MVKPLNYRLLAVSCSLLLGQYLLVAPLSAQGLRVPGGALAPGGAAVRNPSSTQRQADYVVVIVNSEPVTNTEVRERALRLGQQIALQGSERPSQPELLELALDMLVNERLQLHLATREGIKVDDAAVAQAEQNVAAQNRLPLEEVLKRLADDGISRAQFRRTLQDQLVIARIRAREVDARVKVSDAEIDQFLSDQRLTASKAEAELNIAQVLVAVPDSATAAQIASLQARANRVAERARAGEDFAALAREFSDGPEAALGGQIGMRLASRYPDLFVNAVKMLNVGGISEPLRSGAGFHVLKLLDRVQAGGMPTSFTQSNVRHILLRTGPHLTEAQARERLDAMRRTLLAGGTDFVTQARQHSQDGSARAGGDLGWASPGQFVPEFEEVMNALAPGQISAPVTTRFGVHLIQLLERREVPVGEREQRIIARNQVRQRKADEAYNQWMQDLRSTAFIQMREPPQ